MLKNIQMSC